MVICLAQCKKENSKRYIEIISKRINRLVVSYGTTHLIYQASLYVTQLSVSKMRENRLKHIFVRLFTS